MKIAPSHHLNPDIEMMSPPTNLRGDLRKNEKAMYERMETNKKKKI